MIPNIFFFETKPFMAVEMLDVLKDNFYLLSYFANDSYEKLKDSGYLVKTYGNTSVEIDYDNALLNTLKDTNFINSYITTKDYVLFFGMNEKMDATLKKLRIKMALPELSVQEKLGNKLVLNDMCKSLGIEVNKSLEFTKTPIDTEKLYSACTNELGLPFIIQGGHGASGADTSLINNLESFTVKISKLGNTFKASRYISKHIPLSTHICITKDKIYSEGPFVQLLGFKELAINPFQFSGNDTNQSCIHKDIKKKVLQYNKKIADYAKKLGFKGIMGIDYLWDTQENKVFVQEINSRLVGLTRLLTGIQKEQGITPHLLLHLNEFVPLDEYIKESVSKSLDNRNYSQVYISYNVTEVKNVKNSITPGIYGLVSGKLKILSSSLFVKDMTVDDILITMTVPKGMETYEDQVLLKIILKKSVLENNKYELSKEFKDLVGLLRSELLD